MAGLFHAELMREVSMTLSAQQIIDSFERLPEPEKQKLGHEILRVASNFRFLLSRMKNLSSRRKTFF